MNIHMPKRSNDNPVYRTLKEVYLLASDWLLKHGEVADMGEAERLRRRYSALPGR